MKVAPWLLSIRLSITPLSDHPRPPSIISCTLGTMSSSFVITLAAVCFGAVAADPAGYVLPSTGSASTTQFYAGPEFSGGTSCGVSGLPNGQSTSGMQGGGPGYLYVSFCPVEYFCHKW